MKNKHILITLLATALLFAFTACHKDAQIEPKTPKVTEPDVSFTATTANFGWTVSFPGKLSSVVKVSRNADMGDAISYGDAKPTTNKDFHVEITGLSPETQYYYCFEIWNPNLNHRTEVKSFTTQALQKPTVITALVSQFNFTNATAVGGGEVSGDAVTERGIYFGTSSNPVATGTKLMASSAGTGSFTCTMTGLVEETTYYVCAYATNGQGTSFGSEKSFSYNPPPTGAINGLFSVSATQQVYFSQGNLQYIGSASTPYWKFADNQWDYLGTTTGQNSTSQNVDRDLFGWGTSGWNSGAVCYQPWSTSTNNSDYYPGGSYTNNLTGSYANADWGIYNKIYNGGNTAGLWRTLTKDEWVYVLQNRSNASSKYGHGKVNGVCGMILLPDSWTLPSDLNFTAGNSSWANSYTTDQWIMMEANGAVFLPAAGHRDGTSVSSDGSHGYYWSASYYYIGSAFNVGFSAGLATYSNDRYNGRGVRLVQDYQPID